MDGSIRLRPTPPFDFARIVDYLRRSPSSILESLDGDVWERAVRLPSGHPALVRVASTGDVEAPELRVDVVGTGLTPGDRAEAERLVRRVFQADVEAAAFFAPDTFAADPQFGRLVAAQRGLRPTLIASPFEALVWAILGQQVNVAFAAKTKRALVEAFGTRVELAGCTYALFPEPEALAGLEPAALRPLQLSRQKAEYTIGVARAVVEGRLDLEALPREATEAAIERLTQLRGVGRWTAEYVLMRGLGHPDVLPAGDGGLKQVLGRWRGLGRQATEPEIRAMGEAWRPWRGWAAFFWWSALQSRLEP